MANVILFLYIQALFISQWGFMFKNPIYIALIVLAITAFLYGFMKKARWNAYPQNIIVDSIDDFQRNNTP